MIFGTLPTQYDLSLEPKYRQRLPNVNICIKQDNEETRQEGQYTTKTRRMIENRTRESLVNRKLKLKATLGREQSEWDREMSDRLCQREKEKTGDQEINRLKTKLEELCRSFWRREQAMCETLLRKQEDLKRLNLLNASAARDLSKLIQSRSREYKKDCSVANKKVVDDKRNQLQNVLLWETQYLDRVLLYESPEEKARTEREQLQDFIVSNAKLVEVKRKAREEEQRQEEEEFRRKVAENEREKKEEERRKEEAKMNANRQSQAQLDYLNHKRREREDWARQEKERERQNAVEASVREKEDEMQRRRKEREDHLEDLRLSLEMKKKFNEEAKERERKLIEHITAEYSARDQAKLAELAAAESARQKLAAHTHAMVSLQIAHNRKLAEAAERENLATMEYWRARRREMEMEREEEKRERGRQIEERRHQLRTQQEYNAARVARF